MNSIDKLKIDDILKIEKRTKGFYRVIFKDGKKEIIRLNKVLVLSFLLTYGFLFYTQR